MKALVTGGLGFIGSNLVDELVNQGHQVVVIDNLLTGQIADHNTKSTWHNIDVREELTKYRITPDVIFHCAALARIQPSFQNPQETISINSGGTVRVLDLARSCGAKVVYAGSSSFYGDPNINPYSHSKWIGEEHCKMYNKVYGVPVAIARFFNVYGPKQVPEGSNAAVIGIFETYRKRNQPLPVTGTGEQRRDFTHVADIVSGLIAMSHDKWNGEVFNLGSGTNHSIKEVAEMFKPISIDYLPARPGEAWTTLADISFTQEKLGWGPKKSLSAYAEAFLQTL